MRVSVQPTGTASFSSTILSVSKSGTGNTPNASENVTTLSARSGKDLKSLLSQGVSLSIGEEQLIKAIDRAIKALEGPTTMFEMKVHEQTHSIIVRVLNKETGEVLREIPPEKTLDLVVKMMEFAGILIDERV